jgi:hypothetical protein
VNILNVLHGDRPDIQRRVRCVRNVIQVYDIKMFEREFWLGGGSQHFQVLPSSLWRSVYPTFQSP